MRSSRELREVTLPARPAAASGARQQLGSRLHRYLVDLDDSAQGLTDGESLSLLGWNMAMSVNNSTSMQISLSRRLILQLHHGTLFLRSAKPRQQISAMGDGQMGRDQMHHDLASGSFARPRVGRVTISC